MAGILIYSTKCSHCKGLIEYIQGNKQLSSMIQFHNIETQGIPNKQITRVPTMLTKNNKMLIGNEIRAWLESLLPNDLSQCSLGKCSMGSSFCLDNTEDDNGMFNLDMYGQSLQPAITQELQDKINKNVGEAFNMYKD